MRQHVPEVERVRVGQLRPTSFIVVTSLLPSFLVAAILCIVDASQHTGSILGTRTMERWRMLESTRFDLTTPVAGLHGLT